MLLYLWVYFMLYILILLFFIFLLIVVYNIVQKKFNKVKEAFSTVDVYLKKRYDLIPNLVNCVKGYSDFESKVLSDVLMSRNYSIVNLNSAIAKFESYPNLKADTIFINLQKNLNDIEEKISAARRNYNACVNDYNNYISYFPINCIALVFGFKKEKLYSISDFEKGVVKVSEKIN